MAELNQKGYVKFIKNEATNTVHFKGKGILFAQLVKWEIFHTFNLYSQENRLKGIIAHIILEETGGGYRPCLLTDKEIGFRVKAHPVTVNKCINYLAQRGLIIISKKSRKSKTGKFLGTIRGIEIIPTKWYEMPLDEFEKICQEEREYLSSFHEEKEIIEEEELENTPINISDIPLPEEVENPPTFPSKKYGDFEL